MRKRRSTFPTFVIRGSSIAVEIWLLCSESSTFIVRNFRIVKGRPRMVSLVCLKITGPWSSALIAMAITPISGERITRQNREIPMSAIRFAAR